jgi:hypothetical protein
MDTNLMEDANRLDEDDSKYQMELFFGVIVV